MGDELVYLLQGGPYYKIGRTKNLVNRIKVIQTNHPYPLVVVHTWQVSNGAEVEGYLHRKFASAKMHGEWFQLSMDVVEALIAVKEWLIEKVPPERISNPPKERIRPPTALPGSLHAILADYEMFFPIDLAKKAKLSRQYAHLIWTGKRHVSRKMARKIEANAGIPYAALMAAIPPH